MYTFHTLENRNYLRAFTQVFNAISSILESQPRLVLYSSLTHSASPPLFLSLSFPLSIFFPIAWHLKWTKLSVSYACSLCVLCLFHFHFHFHSIFYTFPFLFCCCSPSRSTRCRCCCTLDAILLVINHLKSTLNLSAFLFFPFCLSLVFSSLWFFFYFVFLSVCCSFLALTFTQSATSRAHCTCLGIMPIKEGCEERSREAAAKGTPLLRRPVP